jgi:hypothetical protein
METPQLLRIITNAKKITFNVLKRKDIKEVFKEVNKSKIPPKGLNK